MVCGPIGGVGLKDIVNMNKFLERKGFEIIKQFSNDKNYSDVHDFAKRKQLSKKIVKHDLACLDSADIVVVLSKPSFGASIEMHIAKTMKKKVIFYSKKSIPSPWPIYFSDAIVRNRNELVRKINQFLTRS